VTCRPILDAVTSTSAEQGIQAGSALTELIDLVSEGEVAVLSGAGISTESGIPDYRGPSGRARPASPMTYQDFVGSPEARQRYWARSHVGWRNVARAHPNSGHRAVADLQRAGLIAGLITQNVDGLHQAAGTAGVIELHGSLDRVICLNCGSLSPRDELDVRLQRANPEWLSRVTDSDQVKPDGDVDIDVALVQDFRTVDCTVCGSGPLKPDVVFFGENVPPDRVARCYQLVAGARLLLVLGSSLTVASGFRFVRRAASLSIPVAVLNQGTTRGDALATVRLDAPLGATLSRVADGLR
jgi:NAD-dependent SIR2 family protein deacetylase